MLNKNIEPKVETVKTIASVECSACMFGCLVKNITEIKAYSCL